MYSMSAESINSLLEVPLRLARLSVSNTEELVRSINSRCSLSPYESLRAKRDLREYKRIVVLYASICNSVSTTSCRGNKVMDELYVKVSAVLELKEEITKTEQVIIEKKEKEQELSELFHLSKTPKTLRELSDFETEESDLVEETNDEEKKLELLECKLELLEEEVWKLVFYI